MKHPMVFRSASLAALALFVAGAPGIASARTADENEALRAAGAHWAEIYNKGDVAALAELYTPDARLLPEGQGAVVGRPAIAAFFGKMKDGAPPTTLSFRNIEYFGEAPVVTEVSEVVIRRQDGTLASLGKQILVRVRQGGQWRIHRDIWTNNGPVKP